MTHNLPGCLLWIGSAYSGAARLYDPALPLLSEASNGLLFLDAVEAALLGTCVVLGRLAASSHLAKDEWELHCRAEGHNLLSMSFLSTNYWYFISSWQYIFIMRVTRQEYNDMSYNTQHQPYRLYMQRSRWRRQTWNQQPQSIKHHLYPCIRIG